MTVLKRYSKPRGAGDQASGGRGKLLKSVSGLSQTEVLVRETLQNTWDARREGCRPTYGVRLRKLSLENRRTLREQVFSDTPEYLPDLHRSLTEDNTYVLEIYDRGTVGLNGPIRANEAAAPGEANNFNPLVFDLGTTKEAEDSGGTYGFGKNAAFEASSSHSLVYWSATENSEGEIEHRLIASALGDPYEITGERYTGNHWWGDPGEDQIAPLIGHAARELGESLFDAHFGEDAETEERGTSILIISPSVEDAETGRRTPVRTEEQAEDLIRQICHSVARHAWPKVIPDSSGETPMTINVFHEDQNLSVEADIQRRYSRYGAALAQVRQAQGEGYAPDDPILKPGPGHLASITHPIKLNKVGSETAGLRREFWGSRNDRIAGHLTLMRTTHLLDNDRSDRVPMNQLALMRSKTELIVAYKGPRPEETANFSWHGVFKPTPEVDRHFAAAEPATHDDWKPGNAASEISTSIVERTIKQIRKRVSEFLDVDGRPQREGSLSVKQIANSLSAFAPAGTIEQQPDRPGPTSRTSSHRRSSRHELVAIEGSRELRQEKTLASDQEIAFNVSPQANGPVEVRITLTARTPEGAIKVDDSEFSVRWYAAETLLGIDKAISVGPGFAGRVVLHIPFAAQTSVSLTGEQTQ